MKKKHTHIHKQEMHLVHHHHLVNRCWRLPSALTNKTMYFISVQHLLSKSNMKSCVAGLTARLQNLHKNSNGVNTCHACLDAV